MASSQARQGLGDASGEQGRGATGRGSAQQPAQGPDAPRLPAPEAGAIAPQGKAAKAKQPPGPGPRIAMRNWRISTRLVSLLALPVVAATTLGAFRIEDSWRDIQQQDNMKLLTELTQQATTLAAQLQEERDESAGLIVRDGNAGDPDVKYSRKLTDTALQRFREATDEIDSTDDSSLKGVNATLKRIVVQLNELSDIRKNAYQNNEYDSQTVKAYGDLVDSLLSLSQDMAQATSNSEMIQATRALAVFSSAKENASVQRAIIAAALAQKPADLSEADRLEALSAQRAEENDLKQFEQLYAGRSSATDLTEAMDQDTSIQQANRYAVDILKDAGGLKRTELKSFRDWADLDSVKLERMGKIESTLLQEMEQKSRQLRNEAERDAIINGALIILVLGVSLTGAFIVARSMVRSLRRLQDTAETVSNKRLPELVKQLSEADPEDVDTSVESVGVHSKDEIGKVAQAFDEVHREAVRLAAEQALLRGNVNAMFTNLSRRSQGLIQRQLSLISELESREADPDQLASLFKLDHLATRMRRNGENLLVLAGEEPGRRWTRPVPLVDVLRAAASEVEQYERIELSAVPATQVAGRVVNDLVHLLAELLENATSFSSPQTKVKVTGHALPDGRVLVEIHDTGIGLSPEDLAAINERLASPPTVDVSVSRRMGLFVVGRLSLRHGIRIQLRPSDSGGTTALVMLPVDVTQSGGAGGPGKGGPPPGGQGLDKPGAAKAGATSRLGAVPPRGQLGQGGQGAGNRRPALPARGDGSGPGGTGPGATGPGGTGPGRGGPGPSAPDDGQRRGLPTRSPGGTGAGPGQLGPVRNSSGPSVFDRQGPPEQGGPVTPPGGTPMVTPPRGTPMPTPPGGTPAGPPLGGPMGTPPGGTPAGSPLGGPMGTPADGTPMATPPGGTPAPADARRGPAGPGDDPHSTGETRIAWGAGAPRLGDEQPRGHDAHDSTTQLRRPDFGQNQSQGGQNQLGQTQGGQSPSQDQRGQQLPPHTPAHGTAYPQPSAPQPPVPGQSAAYGNPQDAPLGESAPPRGDEPTPLFAELESDWFRGRGGRAQAPQPRPASSGGPQSPSIPTPPPLPPQQPERAPARPTGPAGAPPQPAAAPTANGRQDTSSWRPSPNDERWRRAEQLRASGPQAGGVTTSGLPRRVPRANLVDGTAQQRPAPEESGPPVSRTPDDVRGRLTSLRRGIQQGRQAGGTLGSNNSGFGPTYQQER